MLLYDSQLKTYVHETRINMEPYLNLIYPLFNVTANATVLEIGPGPGMHTDMILSYNPKELICVEPDLDRETHLTDWFSTPKFVNDDIFNYLSGDPKPADVVVACGVLYHFHSPFYLLELIANKVNPKHILLENEMDSIESFGVTIDTERVGEQAQRIAKNNYKTVNFCVVVGQSYIIKAMSDLGYVLKHQEKYNETHQYKQKVGGMFHFERVDNE